MVGKPPNKAARVGKEHVNAGVKGATSALSPRSETRAAALGGSVVKPPLSDGGNGRGYSPGYSSGGSTPVDSRSLDGSNHGRDRANSTNEVKVIRHSSSVLGLDSMIEARREEGELKRNMVHIEVPFGKPIEEVYDGVHHGPVLGSGISGLVRLVSHKATGVKYAVKCLDLGLVDSPEGLQQLREEIFIMCQLDHPNIVRLEEVYESHSEIYLVQELCFGGELFDRLDEQPDYHYTEGECARLVKQMLCAVRYLHSKGIIHRDLKLENFLFSSTSPDAELKMIDFGLSKHFKFGEVHNEAVGTPYTVAPEVIRGKYDERCDIWAIGVIAYLLLSGDPPFGGCGGPEPLMTVRSNILSGAFKFEPEEVWSIVSPQARDFISKLLVTDPKMRPTARDAQKHRWLREWASRDMKGDDHILNPNVVKALVSFKEFSDMRKLLCEVLSFTLLSDQIKDLRREFEKMDTDGSGEISLKALKQVLMTNAGAGSLGALTETEVEDIFNAMRVRKTEQRIHWHEFIAAGLSQCQVDDRNLRLAFDRLDSDHKGYITFENMMDLMGNDPIQSEDAMRSMWIDSMKACKCHHARITYDDFILLMKGQTREAEVVHELPLSQKLHVVHETHDADEGIAPTSDSSLVLPNGETIVVSDAGVVSTGAEGGAGMIKSSSRESLRRNSARNSLGTPPVTPVYNQNIAFNAPDLDLPLSMDDDDDNEMLSSTVNVGFGSPVPPHTTDAFRPLSLPTGSHAEQAPNFPELGPLPLFTKRPAPYVRRRSRSVDDQDPDIDDHEVPSFGADARRAMMLPEHDHSDEAIERDVKNESKSALVVNRKLYRAHRQMRLAVLEATKRFEEQQARKAHEILSARSEAGGHDEVGPVGAGLVLRRGLKKQISSEAVGSWLRKTKEEQAALVEKANKRGGRGRRQKTNSDMTQMLSCLSSDLSKAGMSGFAAEEGQQSIAPLATVGENGNALDLSVDEDFPPIRHATVPGEFRATKDPFGEGGRYGLA